MPAAPAAAVTDVFIVDGQCGKHCFDPELAFGNVGDPVTWSSFSIEVHDIQRCSLGPCPHDGGNGADRTFVGSPEIEPGQAWSHTFTAPGTYNYYCEVHGYNVMHGSLQIAGEPLPTEPPPPADFDGDGRTDFSVFRPSAGYWFAQGSGGTTAVGFGTAGDLTVPGDYDGDGDTDIAVYRPSIGYWFVRNGPTVAFGTNGDVPVPADYDGDGDDDIAVYRPSIGYWFVNGGPTVAFGTNGDIPVPADYDGDGDDDIAVYRPSIGYWFVRNGPTVAFGTNGDVPVPGDYDGDGDTDVAVYRPSIGYWFVKDGPTVQWGTSGDIPMPLPTAVRLAYFP